MDDLSKGVCLAPDQVADEGVLWYPLSGRFATVAAHMELLFDERGLGYLVAPDGYVNWAAARLGSDAVVYREPESADQYIQVDGESVWLAEARETYTTVTACISVEGDEYNVAIARAVDPRTGCCFERRQGGFVLESHAHIRWAVDLFAMAIVA